MLLRFWLFVICLMSPYHAYGTMESKRTEPQKYMGFVELKTLAKRAESKKLVMPKPMKDGRIQTMNRKGGAIPTSNSLIKDFVEFCQGEGKVVMHIDATYGHHTMRALSENLKEYVATEDNLDHLSLLAIRARNLLDANTLKPLKLFHGKFPDDYSHFPDDHFDAILLNRVIHFYGPDQVKRTMKEVYRILKPGGEVFVVAITPYVKRYESFIPLYKQRKLLRHAYPGHLRNLRMFANPEVTKWTLSTPVTLCFLMPRSCIVSLRKTDFLLNAVTNFPLDSNLLLGPLMIVNLWVPLQENQFQPLFKTTL